MPKPKPNHARENRIDEEIVVDAYTSDERALSWYYYLEEKLEFPFRARCVAARTMSPLKVDEQVDVLAMAKEDDCMGEMLVLISFDATLWKLRPPLRPLRPIESSRPDAGVR